MKRLSTDDRDTLQIRLINQQIAALRQNPAAIVDFLIQGHQGYANMSDEKLLMSAKEKRVAIADLEFIDNPMIPPQAAAAAAPHNHVQ